MTALAKPKPAAKATATGKAKARTAKKPGQKVEAFIRALCERPLPPAHLLPPNPVLAQRGSVSA